MPEIDWADPNLQFIDLSGDGLPDVLLARDDHFVWYRSRGKEGFDEPRIVRKPHDERRGPALVFADGTGSIFLADMTGDGLADIVRVRNGEVAYWPNHGHGRFGRKITLGTSPVLDMPDQFQPGRIRLADVDGTGPTDLIYLGAEGTRIWLNQSGNHSLRRSRSLDFRCSTTPRASTWSTCAATARPASSGRRGASRRCSGSTSSI
ncbi:FG-GAP repeat domain-containing protein [Nannocystis pusilla]|uniref:FG-GAP repeat domain-containing protein n=1 Tax=Nannocystis pusilla TaxID=889268 RepID=UPI003B81C901